MVPVLLGLLVRVLPSLPIDTSKKGDTNELARTLGRIAEMLDNVCLNLGPSLRV